MIENIKSVVGFFTGCIRDYVGVINDMIKHEEYIECYCILMASIIGFFLISVTVGLFIWALFEFPIIALFIFGPMAYIWFMKRKNEKSKEDMQND